jgi:hypothetical protein
MGSNNSVGWKDDNVLIKSSSRKYLQQSLRQKHQYMTSTPSKAGRCSLLNDAILQTALRVLAVWLSAKHLHVASIASVQAHVSPSGRLLGCCGKVVVSAAMMDTIFRAFLNSISVEIIPHHLLNLPRPLPYHPHKTL